MSAIKQDAAELGIVRDLHLDSSDLVDRSAMPPASPAGRDASQPPAEPPLSLVGQPRGALRIGGAPAATGRPSAAPGEALAASLAQLAADVAQLRSAGEERERQDARNAGEVQRSIASIQGSIETMEAFLAIQLPAKIDQMIGEKLTVVQRVQASRRRMRFWLVALLAFNALLLGAALVEARTGLVLPAGRQALSALGSAVEGLGALGSSALAFLRS